MRDSHPALNIGADPGTVPVRLSAVIKGMLFYCYRLIGWMDELPRRRRIRTLVGRRNKVNMVDVTRRNLSLAKATARSSRRAFLSNLLALPMVPTVLSGWWLRSSDAVVVRSGWVLSKDD